MQFAYFKLTTDLPKSVLYSLKFVDRWNMHLSLKSKTFYVSKFISGGYLIHVCNIYKYSRSLNIYFIYFAYCYLFKTQILQNITPVVIFLMFHFDNSQYIYIDFKYMKYKRPVLRVPNSHPRPFPALNTQELSNSYDSFSLIQTFHYLEGRNVHCNILYCDNVQSCRRLVAIRWN